MQITYSNLQIKNVLLILSTFLRYYNYVFIKPCSFQFQLHEFCVQSCRGYSPLSEYVLQSYITQLI